MTIHGHILCWNEIEILPFVIDYWKRIGVDKLYVYDNGSTDGCLEEFKKYDWIEVIHFDSPDGKTDEFVLTQVRNTGWRLSKGKADWVIVSDFDEVPYARTDLKSELAKLEEADTTVVQTVMFTVISDKFPEYNSERLLHQGEGLRFVAEPQMAKTLIFNPNRIENMNYSLGSHSCNPMGEGKYMRFPDTILFFHLKNLGKDYVVRKSKKLYENLPDDIREAGVIDSHYKRFAENYDEEIKKLLESCERV